MNEKQLVRKLQMCAGYSENRAQEAVEGLRRIYDGLPPLNVTSAEKLATAVKLPFLPEIQRTRNEWIVPIPRKKGSIGTILASCKAFRRVSVDSMESVADLHKRFGIESPRDLSWRVGRS